MSKNSPKKIERRRKRARKKERRSKESQVKHSQKMRVEAKVARVQQQSETTFSRSAWQALQPSDNAMQQLRNERVLDENQGFQIDKWKPHAEDSK